MPWTVDNPPKCAKNWSDEEKHKCVVAANAVLRSGKTEQEAIYACIHAAGKSVNKSEDTMNVNKRFLVNGNEVTLKEMAKAWLEKRDFDPNVGGGVDRDKLKDSDFVFSDERKFPVVTQEDVMDAVHSWGRYRGNKTFEQFKRRLLALCRRKGLKPPKSWEKEETEKSSDLKGLVKFIESSWLRNHESESEFEYPVEVFDDYIVTNNYRTDTYYRYNFSINDTGDDLSWGSPVEVVRYVTYHAVTEKSDADAELIEKSIDVPVVKIDEEKRLVYGAVLKPGVIDSQGDICSEEEVEKAAHAYLRNKISRAGYAIDEGHVRVLPIDKACPVESYITTEKMKAGDSELPKGTWVMVTHIADDELWEKVKKNKLNGFSIRGWGKRSLRNST